MYRRRLLGVVPDASSGGHTEKLMHGGGDILGAQATERSMKLYKDTIVEEIEKEPSEKIYYTSKFDDDILKDKAQRRKQQRKMLEKLHRTMARSGATAVLASAHILTERLEEWDGSSKFRNRRRPKNIAGTATCNNRCSAGKCGLQAHSDVSLRNGSVVVELLFVIVANIMTQMRSMLVGVCGAAHVLGNAIGEPPRRHRVATGRIAEDDGQDAAAQDMPLALVWTLNLLVLCTCAVFSQVAIAFAVQAGADDGGSGGAPFANELGESTRMNWRVRLVSLASFSFVAGMGVSPIHPLQSALLCGV
jgi:hypothetical protein